MPLNRIRGSVHPRLKSWYRTRWLRWWKREKRRRSSEFGALVTSRKDWLFETLPKDAAEYQYNIFTKESQRRLAHRLGLATADVYLSGVSLAAALDYVEREGLERFVIKPDSSHNSIGFRPLARTGDRFRDLRDGKELTIGGLRRTLHREYGGRGRPDAWVVEELLLPASGAIAPVEDFKFFCFGGRAELIAQTWRISSKPWKRRIWYTRDWEPVVVKSQNRNHDEAKVPASAADLVAFAEHAAAQLAYPFMRVDLYDTSRGIVFGEFTPGPGSRHGFTPEWDARLAQLWREAAARLDHDIRSGTIRPLGPEREALAAD